mgnify:CR=1 FL=1
MGILEILLIFVVLFNSWSWLFFGDIIQDSVRDKLLLRVISSNFTLLLRVSAQTDESSQKTQNEKWEHKEDSEQKSRGED